MPRRRLALYGTVLLLAGVLLGARLGGFLFEDDMSKALRKVEDAFVMIAQRYVDEVDPDVMAEDAIEGMLGALDPHSAYLDARRTRVENEQFDAEFEGIGVSYDFIDGESGRDTLTVVEVLPGGPSEHAGLVTGDRIVAIDDSTAIGIANADVHRRLKGPRGTTVEVTIRRPGYDGLLSIEITRDRVPIVTVDVAYMMDEDTGFIRLNRFARTTHAEFREAVSGLIEQGMTRLILDLRGNPGGLLSMAVRISGEFLPRGDLIVSQRGRAEGTTESYRSRGQGLWQEGPLIVLVDARSASASEIVAGAIQDHDRGLIVGRRTFGKGLVQNQLPMADGSAMRITVARFYTPSGRLIQTRYENGDREGYYEEKHARMRNERVISASDLADEVADSLKFTTDGGRIVVAGGGIVPDYVVRDDTLSRYVRAVLVRGLEQEFVRTWLDRDGGRLRDRFAGDLDGFIQEFEVTASDLARFRDFAESRGVHVGLRPDGDGSADAWVDPDDYRTAADELGLLLKGRIARRLFDRAAWYPVYERADETLQHARTLWPDVDRLTTHAADG